MSTNEGHPDEARLDDYVEGVLDPDGSQEVSRHLDRCAECREVVAETRRLMELTGDLPRQIPPRRDLWPGVESRIGSRVGGADVGESTPETGRWPRRWESWRPLAAAATLLMTVGVGGYLWLSAEGGPDQVADRAERAAPALEGGRMTGSLASAALEPAERDYLRTTADLLEILDRNRDRLAPETRAALDRTLATIDEAVRDLKAALEEDPNSRQLMLMLESTYRQKIDVLRTVARAVQL